MTLEPERPAEPDLDAARLGHPPVIGHGLEGPRDGDGDDGNLGLQRHPRDPRLPAVQATVG